MPGSPVPEANHSVNTGAKGPILAQRNCAGIVPAADMKKPTHEPSIYHVQTPDGGFTIIGGPLLAAEAGHVWLTKPGGEPLFKVPAAWVRASNRAELARRVAFDIAGAKAPLN